MNLNEYLLAVVNEAKRQGWAVEQSRNGSQIVFPNGKKLHEGHLRGLFPAILVDGAKISALIESVAPGRPCSHKPMKAIIAAIPR
jgi:hypothetical protein